MFGTGWIYPIMLSIGAIVVCTAMELLSVAISYKMAPKAVYSGPGFQGRRAA